MKNWQGIPTTHLTLGGEVMVPRDNRTLLFSTELLVIDKLRVAGVMKNKHRGVSLGVYLTPWCLFFITLATRSLSSLSCCSFVSHEDPPSLVTLKSEKVWLLG